MAASTPLRLQRCWNHEFREAVSRCPGCRRSFCRECVTEFDGRLLCAVCLARAAAAPKARNVRLGPVLRAGGLVFGLLVGWWTVYTVGELLLMIPTTYHEGAAWPSR